MKLESKANHTQETNKGNTNFREQKLSKKRTSQNKKPKN